MENRGEHFLDVVNVVYSQDVPYQTFYKQFRAGFLDNLRKRGDRLAYKNNVQLGEDETMSPTLEATIVLWALERIDPRLPKKVKKMYGHQMVGDHCLVSLQPTIFQNIGQMLNEIEDADIAASARGDVLSGQCNLLSTQQRRKAPTYSARGRQNINKTFGAARRPQISRKMFCRLCYHAGAPSTTFLSHTISTCSYLTKADRADLRSAEVPPQHDTIVPDNRQQAYVVPGWDEDDEDEGSETEDLNTNIASMSINDQSYLMPQSFPPCPIETNALTMSQSNRIIPIPSQVLETQFKNVKLPITLDSGATLSFIRLDLVNELMIPLRPNSQLATLADQQTLITAVGEIDVQVQFQNIPLRLRALVVQKLQAPCFGGTTFHVDNNIVTDMAAQTVEIQGTLFNQSNHMENLPGSLPKILSTETDKPTQMSTVQVKNRQSILPGSSLMIPLKQKPASAGQSVAITPSFAGVNPQQWPAQICPIVENQASYRNNGLNVITCPKYSHFAVNTLTEKSDVANQSLKQPCSLSPPPTTFSTRFKSTRNS